MTEPVLIPPSPAHHYFPLLFNSISLTYLLMSCVSTAHAQADAGSLIKQIEQEKALQVPAKPAPQVVPEAPAKAPSADVKVMVKGFRIQRATLFTEAELLGLLSGYTGRELTFSELQKAADAIAEHYRKHGYLARVYIAQGDIKDGIVTLVVVEARLGGVRLEEGANPRLSQELATRHILARQAPDQSLNLENIQRATNLLNDLPGVNAATILAPGSKEGQTDLIVKFAEGPLLAGNAQLDNYGVPSSGIWRASIQAVLNDAMGLGDQGVLQALKSEGISYLQLGYSMPAGSDGLRCGAYASWLDYELGEPFQSLNANGDASSYGLHASYPFIRSNTSNFNFLARYDHKFFRNYALAAESSNKKTNVTSIGLAGDHTDGWGGGGISQFSLNLSGGELDLSANAADLAADSSTARRNGDFSKLAYVLGRLQRLGGETNLWLSLSGQLASKNLDSSEKFTLGGPSGVRAYPALEANGDEGWLFTAEVRHPLLPKLNMVAFYDHGGVKLNSQTWTNWNASNTNLPNRYELKGIGVGLNWSDPGNYSVRFLLATRIGDNPGRDSNGKDSDGRRTDPRAWLTAVKYF